MLFRSQPAWAAINPQRRARVMFKFKSLIEDHRQELVHLMSSEHGKLLDDSIGEVPAMERGNRQLDSDPSQQVGHG